MSFSFYGFNPANMLLVFARRFRCVLVHLPCTVNPPSLHFHFSLSLFLCVVFTTFSLSSPSSLQLKVTQSVLSCQNPLASLILSVRGARYRGGTWRGGNALSQGCRALSWGNLSMEHTAFPLISTSARLPPYLLIQHTCTLAPPWHIVL